MFRKKKFKLVEKTNDKEMYSAKNSKWIKYSIILGLIGFVLLIILANVKSKSYYQNLKVSRIPTEGVVSSGFRSLLTSDDLSSRTISCSIIACSVTCSGDVSDLKTYLNKQKSCNSMTLTISNYVFSDDRLQSNWLEGGFNLSIIRISKGTLRSIDDGAFNQQTVKYVTELQLSDVELQSLNENTFTGLNSLQKFTLSNHAEIFEGNAFLKPMGATLQKIEIRQRTTNAVNPAPWLRGSFNKLSTVVFDGNNFGTNIRSDTFQHLTELAILTMGSCKITTLPNGVFDFMMTNMVVYISLEKNELTNIAGNYLKKVSSLKRVDLQNNPWDCSCELNELIGEYHRYPDGFGDNVKCSTPWKYAGESLADISLLSCDDTTTTPSSTTSSTTVTSPREESSSISSTDSWSTVTTTTIGYTQTTVEITSSLPSIPSTPLIAEIPSSEEPDGSTQLASSSTEKSEQNFEESTTISSATTTSTAIASTSQETTSTLPFISSTPPTAEIPSSAGPTERTSLDDSEPTENFSPTTNPTGDGITVPPPQTTPSPQNRTTTVSANTIFIDCHRYAPNMADSVNVTIELTAPLTTFSITYLSATSVKLIMEEVIEDLALIWFYDQPHINSSRSEIRIIGEFKIGCQSDVENSLTIEGLSKRRAYTFCLVQEGEEVISPFSCRSYFTSEEDYEEINEDDIWLKSEDKALAIGLFVFGILISLSVGALITYFVLRTHPVLLKGSKRVIIVNRCTGDVLIMPKPNGKQSINESSFRNSFETNTTIPQRRFSETSIQSGLSYMLANNYEDIEYRWKMNIVNDMIYANRVPRSPPPPLPKRTSEIAALTKECSNKIDISVIHTKVNDYGYIP